VLRTNAAWGITKNSVAGDLMIIYDHLNLMGDNPLIGPNNSLLGPRFPDMSEVYSAHLRRLARDTGRELQMHLKSGVYAALTGPSYETPAEIRMLRALGADAVGMSTVPEAIVARHMGLETLAISCISNAAAGIGSEPLSHDEVIRVTDRIKASFLQLLAHLIEKI